jgi:hypothetical protein
MPQTRKLRIQATLVMLVLLGSVAAAFGTEDPPHALLLLVVIVPLCAAGLLFAVMRARAGTGPVEPSSEAGRAVLVGVATLWLSAVVAQGWWLAIFVCLPAAAAASAIAYWWLKKLRGLASPSRTRVGGARASFP